MTMNKISEIPQQTPIAEKPVAEMPADPWRCEECGSLEVSYRTWVDSNTGQVAPAAPEQDDLWCDGCEERCSLRSAIFGQGLQSLSAPLHKGQSM